MAPDGLGRLRADSGGVELEVTPDELAAAAAALSGCARRLGDARASFARIAAAQIPSLGTAAIEGVATSAQRAEQAVDTLDADVDELARTLRLLAALYDEIDRGAISRRGPA